jgi:hypothetical protein
MDSPSRDGEGRRYTDREVRLILESAVELQQRAADDVETSGGLSLAQLEQVAAEAGIEPSLLRRAAAVLDADVPAAAGNRFLGGPTEIVVERVVDTPLDEADFERLLAAVRVQTRHLGASSTVGRLFGWHGQVDGAKTEASATPAGGRTQVRVRIELDEAALGHFMVKGTLFGGAGGFCAAAAAMTALGPLGVLAGGAVLGGGYLWARRSFGAAAARSQARARAIADALVDALAAREARRPAGVALPETGER